MSQEMIDVINEKNEIIGSCEREKIYAERLLHRIVHVLVYDKKGRVLLQLRSKDKDYLPGYWATSAGGHVLRGENTKQAAVREMGEELGIKANLEPFAESWFDSVDRIGLRKFLTVFKAMHNGPFDFADGEVEMADFYSPEQIKAMIRSGDKIHPELKFIINEFL